MVKQTTKRTKQIKRILRKKIHHNRWFVWAIVFSVVVLVTLTVYIKIFDINFGNNILPENEFKPGQVYKDTRLGFSLRYPFDWSIETENDTTINFVPPNLNQQGVSVTILNPKSEKSFRKTLDIVKEQPLQFEGDEATKIYNSILGRGFESVVILKTDKKLYILRGDENLVNKILLTFKILI